MERQIFISYSTLDRDIAYKIVQYLESNGHPCWIAPRNIASGMDYTDVINDAIQNCSALLLVFSEHSEKSQFVKKELATAVSYNKTILPFKISQVELKGGFLFMLTNVQWIDATSRPESKFPQIIDGLSGKMSADDIPTTPEPPRRKWGLVASLASLAAVVVAAVLALVLLLPSKGEAEAAAPAVDTPKVAEPEPPAAPAVEEAATQPAAPAKAAPSKRSPQPSATKETAKEPVKAEPEPIVEPVAEPAAEPATTTPARKADNDRAVKMGKARRYLNNKKYQAALTLFEELKQENPSDKALDALIDECRRNL
ncbi:MAG: toll/interleukin-1 receptor domain-containing protein [Bacteroidales bacterium]|nr:toll/interleukin-1 receptor domain-containing protein [Bacteroidales bacterium]